MTPADQAILFQCQKHHLREARFWRSEADMFADILQRETPPIHPELVKQQRRHAAGHAARHFRFASALTAVVSHPVQPSTP